MGGWNQISSRAPQDGEETSLAAWAFHDRLMQGALVSGHTKAHKSSKDRSASRPSGRRRGFKKRPRKGNK